MTTGYRMLGHVFGVRSEIPGVRACLDRYLEPFRVGSVERATDYAVVARPDGWGVIIDGRLEIKATDRSSVVDWILWHASTEAIASVDDHVVVHAAVAALHGRAVLLIGTTNVGKSTLVGALVQAGLNYLSDEVALVDPASGNVHPFPRALRMDARSAQLLGIGTDRQKLNVRPNDLRQDAIGETSRVHAVVLQRLAPGRGTTLETIPRAEALAELADNTVNLARLGGRAFETLSRTIAHARCRRLQLDDLGSAVRAVRSLLDRP